MRRKGRGDLYADVVTDAKDVAGQHAIKSQEINFASLGQFGSERGVAIAGAENVETGTHQIEGAAVWSYVKEADPKIQVADVCGDVDFSANRACDFGVSGERRCVKDHNIVAACKCSIVVSPVIRVGIGQRMQRI